MILLHAGFLLLLFLASTPAFIDAQLAKGSISIDCGIPEGGNYTDEETGIAYTSDSDYIYTGENRAISSSGSEHLKPRILRTFRTFPEGDRNCYTLKPVFKDNKYLVRAWFFYGDIDSDYRTNGLGIPSFDVFLGLNYWDSISQQSKVIEIIVTATRDYIEVCLMRKIGNPYISALELQELYPGLYTCQLEDHQPPPALILHHRYDLGVKSSQAFMRYRDDPFYRIWTPYPNTSSTDVRQSLWRVLTTNSSSVRFGNPDKAYWPPHEVMSTAVAPLIDTQPLVFTFDHAKTRGQEDFVCIYLHIAEVEVIEPGKAREFSIFDTIYERIRPLYLQTNTFEIADQYSSGSQSYNVSLLSSSQSDLPPLINAIEIYSAPLRWGLSQTHEDDVDALMGVREAYKVKKNWMGDPCLPKNYTWNGLNCTNMPDSELARIVSLFVETNKIFLLNDFESHAYLDPKIELASQGSLIWLFICRNLSFSGLHGNISDSFANLPALASLDLSGNNLSGAVPSFLGKMESLRLLNLSQNNFNGVVPSILLDRSRAKLLQLSFDGNPYLICGTRLCNSKVKGKGFKKTNVEILVPSALLILGIGLWWKLSTRRQDMADKSRAKKLVELDDRQFTYAEIISITNNFEKMIGKGGFGIVFSGCLRDGRQVAVKVLLQNFQGSSQLQTEVELLLRIHHRNLVRLIGYCIDDNKMALVLEYMAQGNLRTVLSATGGKNIFLSWIQRLRIAYDIAQGLEYLHEGCKPPIIHRDVKATNILLNQNLEAKIADFGLSKVFLKDDNTHVTTKVRGTLGYLDPECFISNNVNEKTDVYSYGVLLLELVTGRPPIVQTKDSERMGIVQWVGSFALEDDISEIVDVRVEGDFDCESAWKVIDLAMQCTLPKPVQRPNMSKVVEQLKECLGSDCSDSMSKGFNPSGSHDSLFFPSPR